jgi:hypothetical protein
MHLENKKKEKEEEIPNKNNFLLYLYKEKKTDYLQLKIN